MNNNPVQVFAGGWQQLQHAKHLQSTQPTPKINSARGLDLPPHGIKIWTIDSDTVEIIEFDVPTPWDSSTMLQNTNVFDITTIPSVSGNPMGTQYDYDGFTNYYSTTTTIYKLDAATIPHNAGDLSYNGVSFEPTEETVDIQAVFVMPVDQITGKQKFYVLFSNLLTIARIYEYDMPTKGDLANSVFSGNFIDLNPIIGSNLRIFSVDPGGRYLYVYERNASDIIRFNFRTLKNISSVVITNDVLNVLDKETLVEGMYIRVIDGKKIYITGIVSDNFEEYDMSLATNNSLINEDGDVLVNENGEPLVSS